MEDWNMKQVYDCLPKNRKNRGFTLTEILVTVAILVILMSLATVSFVALRRNLRQKELDAKAEIIYAAAQNRMAELRAAGYGDSFALDADRGVAKLSIPPCDIQEDAEQETPAFYYVKALDKTTQNSAARLLLTETAVDRDLWGSQWIIEYNADTGLVYAVFYSEEKTGSSYLTDSFYGSEDYRDNMRIRSNRLSDGARIGYYGGDLTRINGTYLLHPTIEIVNNEKLTAKFSCVSPDLGNGFTPRLTFQVTIADQKDPTKKVTRTLSTTSAGNGLYTADMILDSLEDTGKKFSQQFPDLVPGNNIAVTLSVTADDSRVDKANYTVYTNSLFAYEKGGSETVARIAYRRHLQNLDTATSNVDPKVTSAILLNDLSYKDPAGGYYSFKPITNESLDSFSGKDNSTESGVFSIKDMYIRTTDYGGLFAKYNGEVKDLVMSNTRVASGTGYAGALIGWVDGDTELINVRVYLSDLSVTKYKTAGEVPGYINGTYAGGLVGLVDTGKELTVTSSASATTVAAVNAAGGMAGLVRGTLNVKTAYTDCYLNSRRTGGLVGAAPVGRIYATGFYTVGYQVATAQAAGILPGALKEGSFHYGYTAVSYTVPAGGSIYTTAGNGKVNNVYTTTRNALGVSSPAVLYDIPGTGSVTSKELSSAEFANSLSYVFRFQVGGDTTPYNLLDQGLTTYPYPMLKNIPHYGDWEENAEGWNFVYFEEYADGTYGVYGSGLKLSTDKPIVGDGYGLLLAEDPTGQWEYQIRYTDKNGTEKTLTYTKTDHASNLKTITSESGITYYLLPMTTWTDSSYGKLVQDSIGRAENSFYCKAELRYWPANNNGLDQSFRTYWFNPYFAKTVIRSEQMPANPGTVSIRDARHLYSLSDYYSAEKNTVNAGRDDLPGLLTNTADKTYTFLQERTVDFDAAYKWGTYYDGKKQPTAFAPIGSDAYPFNAAFNGQSLQVRNADILSKSLYTGFFGYVGSEGDVENLFLVGSTGNTYGCIEYASSGERDVNGTTISSSLDVLRQGAVAGYNEGVVYNCAAAGYSFQVTGYSRSTMYVGGLVGVNTGIVQASSADTPTVTLRFNSSTGYVGGLVGLNTPTGAVAQSYAFGTVTVVESKRATANVAGLVANNHGSVTDCYCGVAFTVSGDTAVYGFAPQGGTVNRGYYLDGGTYSYANKLYSFNISNSGYTDAEGEAITAEQLQAMAITDFGAVDQAHTLLHPQTKTQTFSYSSAVRDSSGTPVHLGNWPNHEKNLGSVGVFYWELEEGGSNPGYHLSYVGYDGTSVLRDNTLCTAHDDGGIITAYGYGYFLKGDGIVNPDISDVGFIYNEDYWYIPEGAVNDTAAENLHAQMPQYVFKAFQTGSSKDGKMYLKSQQTYDYSERTGHYDRRTNGTWKLSYNDLTYNFTLNPFFADAMSLDSVTTTNATGTSSTTKTISHVEPGEEKNSYKIRSVAQLQNINWNYYSLDSSSYISMTQSSNNGNLYNNYPYLSYGSYLTNYKSANLDLYWVQNHDLNGSAFGNYVPIGGMRDNAGASAEAQAIIAYFSSSYDGQAYTIKNISIETDAQCIGVFGVTSGATMKNVVLYSDNGSEIIHNDSTSWYSVGGLVGLAGAQGNANSQLTNCTVSGYTIVDKQSTDPGWGGGCVGGLVGTSTMNLTNCTAVSDIALEITYTGEWQNLRVGGLVGCARGYVTGCYAGGNITSKNPGGSSRIWIGGILGGIVLRNKGNLQTLIGGSENPTTLRNCYSFVNVPSRGSNIKASYAIGSNGEFMWQCRPVDIDYIRIYNSYALNTTAEKSDDYYVLAYKKQYKNVNLNRDHDADRSGTGTGSYDWWTDRRVELINDRNPFLNYAEMCEKLQGYLNKGMNAGEKNFSTVTVTENGFAINGKYSFPGNEKLLTGLNYPFPTILTQTNSFGKTVNVHYGSWPMLGLYWVENEGTIDLFKDLPQTKAAAAALTDGADSEEQQEAQENTEASPQAAQENAEVPGEAAQENAEAPANAAQENTQTPDKTAREYAEASPQAVGPNEASKVFRLRLVPPAGSNVTHSAQEISFSYYAEDGAQLLNQTRAAAIVDSWTAYDSTYTTDVTVKAQAPGTVIIRASYPYGGTTYTADLTVTVTMDLKLVIEKTALEVYEGDTVTAGVHFTDAKGTLVEPSKELLTWRDQIQGTGTAKWSVAEDPENAGKFLLTVEGVHAGTLSGPQSVVRVEYKPDANSESSVTATAQFTVTVKPSIILGLGDGTDFSQVSVPHTPVDGQVEGKDPAEDQQPPKLADVPLYLYSTVDYANLSNFRLDSVYLTIDGSRCQLRPWTAQLLQTAGEDTPQAEEGSAVESDAQPIEAQALPEGTYYAYGDYVLTVGAIQDTAGDAQYRQLTLTKKDGTAPDKQWTLELTLSRLNDDGTDSLGSYYLIYRRPNTVRFFAPGADVTTAAPLKELRVVQDASFTEEELNSLNAELRQMVQDQAGTGHYWLWTVTGNVTGNLNVLPEKAPISYSIAYDGNFEGWQESGEIPRTNLTYGEPVAGLAQSTWTRTGYHFVSWYLSGGTDTDKTAQVVEGKLLLGGEEFIPTEPGQVLTLSARWKVNTYRIVFDGVGSTDSLPTCNETFTFGTQSNYVMPQGITREGFNFMGWSVSESLVLQPGAPWPADFPAENDSTVTVRAEWEQIQQSDELQEDAPVLLPPSGGENFAPTPSEPLTTEPPEPPTEPRKEPQQEPPAEPNSSDGAEGET